MCLCMHVCIIDRVVREGLSDKVTFELGIKGNDEVNQEQEKKYSEQKEHKIKKI